ncbi:unnamed protein product, partial [Cylicostephanus goldi]
MSPEQLESLIDSLNTEAEHLKEKINELSMKVRSFPLGCDRYHRNYWQIPGVPSILVESVESSGPSNPACNIDETCAKDPAQLQGSFIFSRGKESMLKFLAPGFVHPDVIACVEDLVDDVVTARSHTDRRKRKRFRRMDNPYKRGWWSVDTKEALESVRSSLHGRGIRERVLHRLLCKSWFLKDVKLGKVELEKVEEEMDLGKFKNLSYTAVHRRLDELETRINKAKIAARVTANGLLRNGERTSAELRQRILHCEKRINRSFFRPSFCVSDKKYLAHTLKMEEERKNGSHPDEEEERSEADRDEEDGDREDTDSREMID